VLELNQWKLDLRISEDGVFASCLLNKAPWLLGSPICSSMSLSGDTWLVRLVTVLRNCVELWQNGGNRLGRSAPWTGRNVAEVGQFHEEGDERGRISLVSTVARHTVRPLRSKMALIGLRTASRCTRHVR
jgi:hypothetical protein